MTTFGDLLADELRHDPGRPFLTFYDERTGERVELSVTTYANWVAKTASLLVEEHDLERGDVLLVDLPTHWLGPVFLGAAWLAGLTVAFPGVDATPDAVVCGPGRTGGLGGRAPTTCRCWPARCCRWACGSPTRCRRGVHDVGVEVWSQPDAFTPYDAAGRRRRRAAAAQRRRHPGRALELGRRREICDLHRRRPAPVDGEPGFPTRCRRRSSSRS